MSTKKSSKAKSKVSKAVAKSASPATYNDVMPHLPIEVVCYGERVKFTWNLEEKPIRLRFLQLAMKAHSIHKMKSPEFAELFTGGFLKLAKLGLAEYDEASSSTPRGTFPEMVRSFESDPLAFSASMDKRDTLSYLDTFNHAGLQRDLKIYYRGEM